jgi:long-chain acyl-CoA synthetase
MSLRTRARGRCSRMPSMKPWRSKRARAWCCELATSSTGRSPACRPHPCRSAAGATMIYTSGTSGRPKGVKRARQATLGAALSAAATAGAALGLDGSGPHLVTGPLYHAAPLLFALYDQFNGAPMIIMPRWDAEQMLRLLQERPIRHTHMVPTMFVRLLRLNDAIRTAADPSALGLVLHGAAPVAPAVKKQMIEWWGPILVEYWGATEGGVCTLVDSADWLAHPGTVGRATANFEVCAVDEAGTPLPPGEVGTLYCRHKHLATVFEYHGAAEKTAQAYLAPGVFTTGDIGRVDAEGYVYLTDRRSNLIISGGVNIYPAEVEQVLQQHPAIADVAVFGIPDDEWGEAVKAAVELADGWQASPQLAEEILAFARERLARFKVPRSIDFEATLPRHPSGKLYTRLLRERYWKDRGRSI